MSSKRAKRRFKKATKTNNNVSREMIPAAYTVTSRNDGPRITNVGSDLCVTHTEFVTAVTCGSSPGGGNRRRINPGLDDLFPWLYTLAARYELYRFEEFEVIYRPTVGTSNDGYVLIAPEYDTLDVYDDASEADLSQAQGAVEGPIYRELRCRFDVSKMHAADPWKYVRDYYPASDLKSFDAGLIDWFTNGGADTVTGKLYVKYKLRLRQPNVEPATLRPTRIYARSSTAQQTFTTAVRTTVLYGLSAAIGLGISYDGAGVITLGKGIWRVLAAVNFTDSATDYLTSLVQIFSGAVGSGAGSHAYVGWGQAAHGSTVGVGGQHNLIANAVLDVDTTAGLEISVQATVTGATGTLTIETGDTWITVEPV